MPPAAPGWRRRRGSGLSPTCSNPAILGGGVHGGARVPVRRSGGGEGERRRRKDAISDAASPVHSQGWREERRERGREAQGGEQVEMTGTYVTGREGGGGESERLRG